MTINRAYKRPKLTYSLDLQIPFISLIHFDEIVFDWRKGRIVVLYFGESKHELKKRCIDRINKETDNYYDRINVFFDGVLCDESFNN